MEYSSLDEPSAEPAQQPKPPAQSTKAQTPTTVTVNIIDPRPYRNVPLGPNNFFSGMAAVIEFTVRDENGDPMSDIIVTEAVTPASTVQNSSPITRKDGIIMDLVGRGSFGPQLTDLEARAVATDARNTPNHIEQDHVMVIRSASGSVAVASHQRTFSNVDARGNLNRVVSRNGYSNNYTMTMSEIKVTPIRAVICLRFR